MKTVASVLLALAAILAGAAAGRSATDGCPRDRSLGTVIFVRGGTWHAVSLADCREHPARAPKPPSARAALRSREGRVATIVAVHATAREPRLQPRVLRAPRLVVRRPLDGRRVAFSS